MNEYDNNDQFDLGHLLLIALVTFLVCLMMASCKTPCKITESRDVLHDTTYITHTMHDSIYLRDSIWVETFTKGDTIYRNKNVTKIEYRDRLKTDTLYKTKTDTVYYSAITEQTDKTSALDKMLIATFIGTVLISGGGAYLILKKS